MASDTTKRYWKSSPDTISFINFHDIATCRWKSVSVYLENVAEKLQRVFSISKVVLEQENSFSRKFDVFTFHTRCRVTINCTNSFCYVDLILLHIFILVRDLGINNVIKYRYTFCSRKKNFRYLCSSIASTIIDRLNYRRRPHERIERKTRIRPISYV